MGENLIRKAAERLVRWLNGSIVDKYDLLKVEEILRSELAPLLADAAATQPK